MDWLQFLQIICIPIFGWLFYEVGNIRHDLADFKLNVAKDYATNDDFRRLESKIDDLRDLIIEEFKTNGTARKNKKA